MLDPDSLPAPRELERTESFPDPLETFDGERIEAPAEWRETRREELKTLFGQYIYGHAPEAGPDVEFEVHERGEFAGGTMREIDCILATGFSFRFLHLTPEPGAPTFVAPNGMGNHAVHSDERVTHTDAASEFGFSFVNEEGPAERGEGEAAWCPEYLVERGYGLLTVCAADVDPDRDEFTDGVQAELDAPGPAGTGWGALRAWAWGLSRGVDYLEDGGAPAIAFGHSRFGKAALLAGAFDERFDAVVPHQSGTGGMAPARDNDQETVGEITTAFPHWFCDFFPAFAGRVPRLPVDSHELVALVAPRPLLDTAGLRDVRTNPPRALDALRAAAPVYDLLGGPAEVDRCFPGDDAGEAGALCQYRRATGHTMERGYWAVTCDFLDTHL